MKIKVKVLQHISMMSSYNMRSCGQAAREKPRVILICTNKQYTLMMGIVHRKNHHTVNNEYHYGFESQNLTQMK